MKASPRTYDTKVYRVLSRAARLGEPVPSLKDIALKVGCPVTGRGRMSQVIKRLETEGKILVEREDGLTVRITIASTGKSTARVVKNRPGYVRPRVKRPTAAPEQRKAPDREPEPPAEPEAPPAAPEPVPEPAKPVRGGGNLQMRAYPQTRLAGRCQYIAGEPSADDACKHGAPTVPGSAYCAEHLEICTLRRPVAAA